MAKANTSTAPKAAKVNSAPAKTASAKPPAKQAPTPDKEESKPASVQIGAIKVRKESRKAKVAELWHTDEAAAFTLGVKLGLEQSTLWSWFSGWRRLTGKGLNTAMPSKTARATVKAPTEPKPEPAKAPAKVEELASKSKTPTKRSKKA